MKITLQDDTDINALATLLRGAISLHGRFTADVEQTDTRTLKILNVRLREKKPYCGSHPGACQIPRKHASYRYLEGADWVEFNDLLNSVLDRDSIKARVESTVVVLRQGYERCIEYRAQGSHGRNAEWAKYGIYENHCGKQSPASRFPIGTPGSYQAIGYHAA